MANQDILQTLRILTAANYQNLKQVQPQGIHPRKTGGEDVKAKMARVTRKLHGAGALGDTTHDYLIGWAEKTRQRRPRPTACTFLEHR